MQRGVVFNLRAAQICAGQIDRLQKILDTAPILHFKLLFQLLDRQFQAPHYIPVLFQQAPGVVVAGSSSTFFSTGFLAMLRHPFLQDAKGQDKYIAGSTRAAENLHAEPMRLFLLSHTLTLSIVG